MQSVCASVFLREKGMKILAHGMHTLCMHYACTCSHYIVYRHYTSQRAAACNMEERCLFEKLYLCSEKDPLSHASTERIIRASKQYEDDLHIELEKQQERNRKCPCGTFHVKSSRPLHHPSHIFSSLQP